MKHVQFVCSLCQHVLQTGGEFCARVIECPYCHGSIKVPVIPSRMIKAVVVMLCIAGLAEATGFVVQLMGLMSSYMRPHLDSWPAFFGYASFSWIFEGNMWRVFFFALNGLVLSGPGFILLVILLCRSLWTVRKHVRTLTIAFAVAFFFHRALACQVQTWGETGAVGLWVGMKMLQFVLMIPVFILCCFPNFGRIPQARAAA